MNISLNWLSTHLDLAGKSIREIDDLLTFAGVEVEGIVPKGVSSEKIVVAQIKEAVQHPNADRLKVTQVDAGEGALLRVIVGIDRPQPGDAGPRETELRVMSGDRQGCAAVVEREDDDRQVFGFGTGGQVLQRRLARSVDVVFQCFDLRQRREALELLAAPARRDGRSGEGMIQQAAVRVAGLHGLVAGEGEIAESRMCTVDLGQRGHQPAFQVVSRQIELSARDIQQEFTPTQPGEPPTDQADAGGGGGRLERRGKSPCAHGSQAEGAQLDEFASRRVHDRRFFVCTVHD